MAHVVVVVVVMKMKIDWTDETKQASTFLFVSIHSRLRGAFGQGQGCTGARATRRELRFGRISAKLLALPHIAPHQPTLAGPRSLVRFFPPFAPRYAHSLARHQDIVVDIDT